MYTGLPVKCPVLLYDDHKNCIFVTDFRKILVKKNLMKIRPVGFELFHADGRTGGHMTKLPVVL